MLMPHPAVLRTLVAEYEAATASGSAAADTRAQDLAYTLCVSTGTREVTRALEVARSWLAAATDTDTDTAVGRSTDDGPHVYA
ncbi:DUF5133 domain-containing protein [Streptomyces sp. NPDC088766]|uniref:DUF5133 domain-containing protein n=1 Tax=Streptomyces sp. NPDC088766 TaxID=3365893 RepID=UPI003811E679